MLFAPLKRILGLGRLRVRGPCGAKDEFLLAATARIGSNSRESEAPVRGATVPSDPPAADARKAAGEPANTLG